MANFLQKYNLPKLNQGEIENLNKLTTNMGIKTNHKSSDRSPVPDGFRGGFYQKI